MKTSYVLVSAKYFLSLVCVVVAVESAAKEPVTKEEASRTLSASYSQVIGKNSRFYSEVVGAGRAAEGLRTDWQRDLLLAQRECGFKYIRFHGLLQDEMGVYSEDKKGNPIYNFQYIDVLYDSILNAGMKPFVELSFMPEKMVSGDKTVFWWKGNITPPKDHAKWQALIQNLMQHWTKRYGEAEVKQWYFEVWNEPNLHFFWSGTQADYFKLYDVTVKAIKSVSSQYRVGGPATAGRAWISETIDFATKNKLSLDFITTHDYGVEGIGFDEDGEKLFLFTDPGAIIDGVREVNGKIRASAMPHLPLHYTEWSASYSPRDPIHDSYISAPYIVSKLKGSVGFADSMSYWTFTDIFEESGVVPSPFHGGFGMINFQGLRKPSFYAYQFLNRLGQEELASTDKESWVTRTTSGIQMLLWNLTLTKNKESNQVYYKRDIPTKKAGTVSIKIVDMPAGDYQLNLYQVGYKVNDVYSSFLSIGSPKHLTREQVKELADKNNGRALETTKVTIEQGKAFTKELSLRENDLFMITLEKK
jgi:xylan 1,4-beta-xylosidase